MATSRKPKPAADNKLTEATRYITPLETLRLWVRSGGRCANCNKYLMEEPELERPINLAERAHAAGWKESEGSPRSNSAVLVADRNNAENLLLLCQDCHTVIDHPDTREDYPEERLLQIKREHEERIRHLTAMGPDRETAVLRVFGAIRGSVPEMARDVALRTVVDGSGRYGRFPLAAERHGIEIDLTNLPDPETVGGSGDAYWTMGRLQIDGAMTRINEAVHSKHLRHLSVFALARIPLLVYLGYALDDKIPVDLYQKHRGEGEGWLWPGQEKAITFEVMAHNDADQHSGEEDDVAVILALSGTIPKDDLPQEAKNLPLFELRPAGGVAPSPNLFRSRATLDAFVREWQELLSQLEIHHKKAARIHLFAAVPITAAIASGRVLMRHVHPELRVYDRIGNEFRPAITVNERQAR